MPPPYRSTRRRRRRRCGSLDELKRTPPRDDVAMKLSTRPREANRRRRRLGMNPVRSLAGGAAEEDVQRRTSAEGALERRFGPPAVATPARERARVAPTRLGLPAHLTASTPRRLRLPTGRSRRRCSARWRGTRRRSSRTSDGQGDNVAGACPIARALPRRGGTAGAPPARDEHRSPSAPLAAQFSTRACLELISPRVAGDGPGRRGRVPFDPHAIGGADDMKTKEVKHAMTAGMRLARPAGSVAQACAGPRSAAAAGFAALARRPLRALVSLALEIRQRRRRR